MLRAIRVIRGRALSVYAGGVLLSLLAPVACGDGDTLPKGGAGSGGGAGTGGSSGRGGGSGEGGDAGRGTSGTGGKGGTNCPTVSFVNPQDGAKLTEADDAGAGTVPDSCSDGFQYDVKASTSAGNGTKARLYSGTNLVAEATVKGGEVTFSKAQLSIGVDSLKVQVGDDACSAAQATVEVSCQGLPSCDITKPVVSATHPALNGVPVAQGGDRASAVGSPYQVAFEVTTNVEDGRPVSLQINDSAQLITAFASGGKATFAGVPLSPDGEFSVAATCQAESGKTAHSGAATFTVDTTAPAFQVTTPVAGKHFGPSEDSDPALAGQQFQVCGVTQSLDALNLPDNLGAPKNNFCVGLGTATPLCVPATGDGSGAPCVTLTCQDRVPFELKVSLGDLAGNSSQTSVQAISCTSELPGVAIINPVDGTGTDNTTHILAATATVGRKDENGAKPGAQFTVVACTDVPSGPMTLMGAVKGQTLQSLATTTSVAAVPTDNCPVGKAYVGKFVAATLPESEETVLGELINPTELAVTVSDQGTTGTSPAVDVWVDSVSPSINQYLPNPLCGSLIQSTTAVSKPVTLLTSSVPVLVTVTNNGSPSNYTATEAVLGQAPLGSVAFGLGVNTVVATTVDPAGNPGALISPCEVSVGNPPSVAWSSPSASKLNISNDADPDTAGWQGTLSVQTDVGGLGATVQFSTGDGNLGAPVAVDGTGKATSPVLSLSDSASLTLTATTSDVPGRGVGTAKLSVVVDTVAPISVASLSATVPPALRRQTTFHLGCLAPSDNGSAVSTYDVRIARGTAITGANFDAQEKVSYSGAPSAPGLTDGVDATGRLIENDYYFAVAAVDKGGNRGPIAFAGPTAAHFKSTLLSNGVAGEAFGFAVDGSTSLDGDSYSDLVVGSYNSQTLNIYMGSATGYPSTPTSKITGSTVGFGSSAAIVGDIDSDGLPDLAVGSPNEGNGVVFIFKGRRPWPASLQQSAADYVIQAGAGFEGSLNGSGLAGVGDYNGDGVDDIGIGAPLYGGTNGRLSVVFGAAQGQPFGTAGVVSLPADYGTKAVQINGTNGAFGQRVTGLNRFYAGGGSTLVATATIGDGAANAFHGLNGASAVTTPDQTFAGPMSNGRTGIGLAFLGGGVGLPLVAVGSPAYNTNPATGRVDVFGGDVSSGPFSGLHTTYTNSKATSLGDGFGVMAVGGAFASGVTTSFLGDNAPDLVVGGFKEGGAATHVYFLTAQNAISGGTRDIVAAADASYQMPADWQGCAFLSSAIRDADGDGYGDLAIGEFRRTSGYNGRVLVLW